MKGTLGINKNKQCSSFARQARIICTSIRKTSLAPSLCHHNLPDGKLISRMTDSPHVDATRHSCFTLHAAESRAPNNTYVPQVQKTQSGESEGRAGSGISPALVELQCKAKTEHT